jgi:exonuclease III
LSVKQRHLDAIEMDEGRYFSSIGVENKKDKLCWEIINVYGPVKTEKAEFLHKFYQKIQRRGKPMVVCGDFNMVRYCHEKSSGGVHSIWMDMFNGFIEDTSLIEKKRVESTFT